MKLWGWVYGTCAPILCTIFLLENVMPVTGASRAKLHDNGYEDVLVAIHTTVDETLGDSLIEAVKDIISAASKSLYQATNGTLFFRSVSILIPNSWNRPEAVSTNGENFEDNDIKIDIKHPIYKHQPYTQQDGGCGKPGRYIHITPEYLTDAQVANPWGSKGKVLLREWAKLRWGIFDELGYENDPLYPLFYQDKNEAISPTLCSDKPIKGRTLDTKGRQRCHRMETVYDQFCRFQPMKKQEATSSLMSFQAIQSANIVEFCDSAESDHPHNADAPTKQNAKCNGQSAWEVIRKHSDFNNGGGGNGAAGMSTDPQPTTFRVLKHYNTHYALVLDYSSSMNDKKRVDKMVREAKRWLRTAVGKGSHVAIIRFSTTATLLRDLTEITDDASRNALISSLETIGDGRTCIGCGLLEAIKVLEHKENQVIFLLTDGEENENCTIKDVTSRVIISGAKVVTLAFGPSASEGIEKLSRKTDGKTFAVNDNDSGTNMEDAFESVLTYQPPIFDPDLKIYNGPANQSEGTFQIDASIGRNTTFRLSANVGQDVKPMPRLIGPNGSEYANVITDINTESWYITVDMAEVGEWHWKLGLTDEEAKSFRVKITSHAREKDKEAIRTTAWMSEDEKDFNATNNRIIIYAQVTQGNNPVVNADVRALVTPPDDSHSEEEYNLLDNGQGADNMAGDGIYSRYMTRYGGNGRYSVRAEVRDGGKAFVNSGDFRTRDLTKRSIDNDNDNNGDIGTPVFCCGSVMPLAPNAALATGSFTRVAAAGSLKVTNITSQDTAPPVEVRDLQVTLTDPTQSHQHHYNLSFTWTASGDDLDDGIVSEYIIRMSPNRSHLRESNFDDAPDETDLGINSTEMNLLVEAGDRIFFTTVIETKYTFSTLYFALRAIDDVGLKSLVSNVAVLQPIPVVIEKEEEELLLPVWSIVLIIVVLLAAAVSVLFGFKREKGKYQVVEHEVVEMRDNPSV